MLDVVTYLGRSGDGARELTPTSWRGGEEDMANVGGHLPKTWQDEGRKAQRKMDG